MCAFHFSNSAQSLSPSLSTSTRLYVPGGVTDCTRYWPPWVLFCLVTSVYWINNYPLMSCTCGCICLWLLSLLAKESSFRYVEGYSCMWSIGMVTIHCLSCTCSCAIADLFLGRRLQWTFLSSIGQNFQLFKWRVVSNNNRIVWKSCSSLAIYNFFLSIMSYSRDLAPYKPQSQEERPILNGLANKVGIGYLPAISVGHYT